MAVLTETIGAVSREVEDLRQCWQGRTLAACTVRVSNVSTLVRARDPFGMVLLSMLAHRFDTADELWVLLHIIHPGFQGITGTFCSSIGRVNKAGRVVADVYAPGDLIPRRRRVLFQSVDVLKGMLRKFADQEQFTDQERLEFFSMAKLWLAADERLDPTMHPNDPDAKRLVH